MERKTANDVVAYLRDWWDGLDENKKNDLALFAIIGDMREHQNYEAMGGDGEDMVMALAQSMVSQKSLYRIVLKALEVVDVYVKGLESDKKTGEKKVFAS